MGAVKALIFLEWRLLTNKVKNYRKYRLQSAFIVLSFILFIFLMLTIPGGVPLEFSDTIMGYSELIIGGLILIKILLRLVMGRRFPVNIIGDSPTLLLCLPLSSRSLVIYFLFKQLLFQAIGELYFVYSLISILGKAFLPQGFFFAWIGFLLLDIWTAALSLLFYSIKRRFFAGGYNLWAGILVVLVLFLAFSGADPQTVWEIIHPQNWWPAKDFYFLIYNVFKTGNFSLWSCALRLVLLNMAALFLALLNLEYTREEIAEQFYLSKQNRDEQSKIVDPDEAMLKFFGAKRQSWVANRSWRPGVWGALVWKELVTWERLKPIEFKFGVITSLAFGGISGLLAYYLKIPLSIILLFALLNGLGGGKASLGIFHSMICQLPGRWLTKLAGVSILPAVEGSLYHFISLVAVSVTLLFLQGISGLVSAVPLLFSFLLLLVPLNFMFMMVGVFYYLLSLCLVGLIKKSVKVLPVFLHFVIVIAVGEYYQWKPGSVILLAVGSLFLAGFWLWSSSRYLTANFARIRES
ncbi:MAG: hypothetical protein GX922_00060 [Firmicutes bacterium]|nr:hypothetical protein [Bacillota bacterium]